MSKVMRDALAETQTFTDEMVDRYSLANGDHVRIHWPINIAPEEATDLLTWLQLIANKIERATRIQPEAAAVPEAEGKPDWLLQREKLAAGMKDRIVNVGKPDPIYQQAWDRVQDLLQTNMTPPFMDGVDVPDRMAANPATETYPYTPPWDKHFRDHFTPVDRVSEAEARASARHEPPAADMCRCDACCRAREGAGF